MNPSILETLLKNPKARAPQTQKPIPEKPPQRKKRSALPLILGIILGILVLTATAWSAINNPALAARMRVETTPTAQARSWSQAFIAKPTYTPTAVFIPSPTPANTLAPTSAPDNNIMAQIVADTPTPGDNSSQNNGDASAPSVSQSGKYILVSISEQHLYAYENNNLVYSFVASTGMNNATRVGNFAVQDKIPSAYGATWNIWMPDWLGIYYAGSLENGIHALPILSNGATLWAGFLGTPISFGCVVLGTSEAQQLYNWADVGTPVDIQR